MKFTTSILLFATSSALVNAQGPPAPAWIPACKDAADVNAFISCFVENMDSECIDQDTSDTLQDCLADMVEIPTDVTPMAFVMNSVCLDDIKECLHERGPYDGDRPRARIPPSIMEACSDIEDILEFAECFILNVDSLCDDTATNITQCVQEFETESEDILGLIQDSGCFDTASTCMKIRYDEFMVTLPECVPETIGAMGQCIRENREICASTCNETASLEGTIDTANTDTCYLFSTMCDTSSCCEPCVESFQSVVDCIVSEYLPEETCEFDCPTVRRGRQLLFERIKKLFGKGRSDEDEAESPSVAVGEDGRDFGERAGGGPRQGPVLGECLLELRTESDVDLITEEDVVDFFVCLTDKYLEMITKEPIEGHPGLRGQSGGQPRGGQPRDGQPGGRPRGGH
mmetsp:Transcript_173/g.332  ORF Transcript_173/g.332 Transcript_173/m.332 type:complete len:402 (+) Transcript_173:216-1421(+)